VGVNNACMGGKERGKKGMAERPYESKTKQLTKRKKTIKKPNQMSISWLGPKASTPKD